MTGLFDGTFARGGAAQAVSDEAWFRALLDAEAALARAAAGLGLVPTTAADAVTAAAADPGRLDLATVIARAADDGNPVPPLVRVLRDAVGERDAVAVHVGATSQDILDTALVLLARNAIAAIDADLAAAADAAARLAAAHRDDVVMGRTLLQQALPTTFGLKAAGWLAGLDGARLRLAEVRASLPVQYGGAAGTLAASRGSGVALRTAFAAELGLADTPAPWHTVRLPIADLAGALGAAAGVVATVAVDIVLLAQTEVAEVSEGGSAAAARRRCRTSTTRWRRSPPAPAPAARPGWPAPCSPPWSRSTSARPGPGTAEWPTLTALLTDGRLRRGLAGREPRRAAAGHRPDGRDRGGRARPRTGRRPGRRAHARAGPRCGTRRRGRGGPDGGDERPSAARGPRRAHRHRRPGPARAPLPTPGRPARRSTPSSPTTPA